VEIDVWSDIACPWCYVGKRRFEAALEAYDGADDVTVTWRSFELDPGAPAEREGDNAILLAEKYGMSREDALASMESLTQTATLEGLDFQLNDSRGGNTFDAHRLTHLAAAHGLQDEMKERLMRAHQCERELLSDHATLARLAAEVGLPATEVTEVLASDRFAEEVRDDEALAAQLGIRAVPCFVFDRRLGVSGAQSPDVLVEMMERAAAEQAD